PAGTFSTGLQYSDVRPKPTYYAYRLPLYLPVTSGGRNHDLEVWGCVRPAHYAGLQTGKRQRVEIQFEPESGHSFGTVKTVTVDGRYGYFDVRQRFPGSGTVRLKWTYPNGQAIFSRSVRLTLR